MNGGDNNREGGGEKRPQKRIPRSWSQSARETGRRGRGEGGREGGDMLFGNK